VHIRFENKRVTASADFFFWTFFYQPMAGCHHFLIDSVKNLWP